MIDDTSALLAEVDAELTSVDTSADLPDSDEPVIAPYQSRLRSLRDAVVAMELFTPRR